MFEGSRAKTQTKRKQRPRPPNHGFSAGLYVNDFENSPERWEQKDPEFRTSLNLGYVKFCNKKPGREAERGGESQTEHELLKLRISCLCETKTEGVRERVCFSEAGPLHLAQACLQVLVPQPLSGAILSRKDEVWSVC